MTNTILHSNFQEQFPDAHLIRIWARVKLYEAELNGQPVLILDDGGIDENGQPAMKVFSFEDEAARAAYLDQKYPYSRSTDPALTLEERMAADVERDKQRRVCRICEG